MIFFLILLNFFIIRTESKYFLEFWNQLFWFTMPGDMNTPKLIQQVEGMQGTPKSTKKWNYFKTNIYVDLFHLYRN